MSETIPRNDESRHLGDPLSWLGTFHTGPTSSTKLEARNQQQHNIDVDYLIRPTSNFLDDVVTHPSSAAPTVSTNHIQSDMEMAYYGSRSTSPTDLETRATPITDWTDSVIPSGSMPPPKSRHYDDEDYRSHRHLAYPHVHQPLKVMEPRTLRRVRERLLAVRAALQCADGSVPQGLSPSFQQTSLSSKSGDSFVSSQPAQTTSSSLDLIETNSQIEPIDVTSAAAADIAVGVGSRVNAGESSHILDPSSPSLAERACALGQAVKSRHYKADPWSVPQLACSQALDDPSKTDSNLPDLGNSWKNIRSSIPIGSLDFTIPVPEDRSDFSTKLGLRYRKRRRSRGKSSIAEYQPSLAKLSEEGSPISSSTASSSMSLQFIEPESSTVHGQLYCMPSPHGENSLGHGVGVEGGTINASNVVPVSESMCTTTDFPSSSQSLQKTPTAIDLICSVTTGPIEVDNVSHGTTSEVNSCHELDGVDVEDGSLKAFRVTASHLQHSVNPCDPSISDAIIMRTPTQCIEAFEHGPSSSPTLANNLPLTSFSARDHSPLYPFDGDSIDLHPAPLARPESVNTCDEATVASGDQLNTDPGPSIDVHHSEACHRSSQLAVRTLTGMELKQLNLWKRHLRSRSTAPMVNGLQAVGQPQETPVPLDKDSVEVESHRYFELPGTRRRRRLLWAGFRASQRRWESLEQAATEAKSDARLRQCVTASGHLDSLCATDNSIGAGHKRSSRSHILSPSRTALGTTSNTHDEFRPRRGSLSLPELLESVDGLHLSAGPYGPNEDVLESQIAARYLVRPDGSRLDYVPPVFAELDVLNCSHASNAADGTVTIGDTHPIVVGDSSHKTASPSLTPSQLSRCATDDHSSSPGLNKLNWSWLETARWVRYEQDVDPVTGAFGQAHSPPLTFQAVVECRRYLEQGAIVLPSDPKIATSEPPYSYCGRICRDRARLLAVLDIAMLALSTDCGASANEVALIRHVLTLRHQHVCDLRHHHHHHTALFQPCTGLLQATNGEHRIGPGSTEHQGHTASSLFTSFFTRSRRKSAVTHATTSVDLRNNTSWWNQKRTTSVPVMDHHISDVERGLPRAPHPSFVSPSHMDGENLAQRAVSALRRAFTPTHTLLAQLSANTQAPGDHNNMTSTGRDAAAGVSSHTEQPVARLQTRVSTPDSGRVTTMTNITTATESPEGIKHPSDLAGRLRSSTEIVSVQVGVLPGLRRPMLAFVRLQRALFAPGLTELRDSHPIRFLILFLGPERRHLNYSEVGRVIATMMVDKAFRRTAYTAVCRDDLLDGLRTFLDTTIVLPMLSDITPRSLLAMHDQLRLFRRHRSSAVRDHSNIQPLKSKRSRTRVGDGKLSSAHLRSTTTTHITGDHAVVAEREPNNVIVHKNSEVMSTDLPDVPEVIVTPPPLLDSVAAVRVKQELRKSFNQKQTTSGPESTVRLLRSAYALGVPRNGDDGTSRLSFTSLTASVGSHSSNKHRQRKSVGRSRASSAHSTSPCGVPPAHLHRGSGCGLNRLCRDCCRLNTCRACPCPFGVALCTDLYAYRRRFWSDLIDPFRPGSRADLSLMFATVVFLYFVVLAPAVTFGALMVSSVSPTFTIPLCIFASGTSQCLFTLFGGQPLLIVGITGPMLIIETCIKLICDVNQAPLGWMRLLVAIYTSLFGMIAVFANAGWLVLRVRRSLEEVFNFFVSFYFIFKAFKSLFQAILQTIPPSLEAVSQPNISGKLHTQWNQSDYVLAHSEVLDNNESTNLGSNYDATWSEPFNRLTNQQQQQAGAIVALLIAILMFSVCCWLQAIKRGRYFRRTVRNLFGYFNVPIGLVCAVCVNRFLFAEIHVPTVQMPPKESMDFSHLIAPPPGLWSFVSRTEQSASFVSPMVTPSSHGLAALMAACLLPAIATDTLLSGITVAKSERRLRKPCLFSLDLVVTTCLMPLVSGIFGWPFLSPAAVRSNTHVIALTKWNTRTPPGVPHRIVGCVEQRVTGLAIGLLVALSVTLEARLFALVPMGALYGMFLYMGAMGLRDLVIVRRICALLKRRKHWKDREYLRHLPPSAIALFVSVQLGFIALLLAMNWVTEFALVGATSLVFPFILLLYALTRECVLPRCTLLHPYLEQMDRLHKLLLPKPHLTAFCCTVTTSTTNQHGHRSSSDDDGQDADDDQFITDISARTSLDSQAKLNRKMSTAIPSHNETDSVPGSAWFGVLRRTVRTSHGSKLAHVPSSNVRHHCRWTASSGLDRLRETDSPENKDPCVSGVGGESAHLVPSRSWNRFQRKFSGLFFHSLDASTAAVMGNRVETEIKPPTAHHIISGRNEPLATDYDEDSPLLMHIPRGRNNDQEEEEGVDDDIEVDHASSLSLSNVEEEYSESELESRMDNPYWLD